MLRRQKLPDRMRVMGTILEEKGVKPAPTLLEARGVKPARSKPSGRNADPRRSIPLNSSRWQKMRARVLAEEPLCRRCQAPATDVDHVNGDPSDNSRANLQPLCHACHSHKTGRERAGLPIVHGHDVNGMPLDPAHPWNQAEKSPEGLSDQTGRSPSLHRNGRG